MRDVMSIFTRLARDGARYAPSAEDVARETREKRQRLRAERLEHMRGVITEQDYHGVIADELASTPALDLIKRWHDNRPRMQVPWTMTALLGDPGIGKTVAAAWLIAEVGGEYITAEALRRLFASYNPTAEVELRRLLAMRCLVVDDLGTEREEDTALSSVFEVVNKRQGWRGWTVFTANMTVEQFTARYGERTVARIRHQGELAELGGSDLRRKG